MCQVGEGVVPGQVLPIPGVSVPAVCAVRWDDPGTRLERAWLLTGHTFHRVFFTVQP